MENEQFLDEEPLDITEHGNDYDVTTVATIENDQELELNEDEEKLREFMDEMKSFNPDEKISVYRQPTSGKQLSFLFSFHPSVDGLDYSSMLERLQNEYGGGKYRVQIRKDGRLAVNKVVEIESKKVNVEQNNNSDIATALAMIAESNNRNTELIMRAITENQPKQKTESEMLDNMVRYKELFGDKGKVEKPKTLLEQLTELNALKEIAPTLFGGGGNDSSPDLSSLLVDGLGSLKEIVTAPPNPQVNASTEQRKTNPTETPEKTGKKEMNQNALVRNAIRKEILKLVNLARNDKEPSLYAEVALDSLPPHFMKPFMEVMGKGDHDFSTFLIDIEPTTEHYMPWFLEFKGAIIEMVQEANEEGKGDSENQIDLDLSTDNLTSDANESIIHNEPSTTTPTDT